MRSCERLATDCPEGFFRIFPLDYVEVYCVERTASVSLCVRQTKFFHVKIC